MMMRGGEAEQLDRHQRSARKLRLTRVRSEFLELARDGRRTVAG